MLKLNEIVRESFLWYLLCRYDLYEIEVKCAKNITRSDGVFGAPSGYVYIELQMDEELFEGGRTVR